MVSLSDDVDVARMAWLPEQDLLLQGPPGQLSFPEPLPLRVERDRVVHARPNNASRGDVGVVRRTALPVVANHQEKAAEKLVVDKLAPAVPPAVRPRLVLLVRFVRWEVPD